MAKSTESENSFIPSDPKVAALFAEFSSLDKSMYEPYLIANALDIAFSSGSLAIFLSDCTVSTTRVTSTGIGKTPSQKQNRVLEKSSVLNSSLGYLANTLKDKGVDTEFWVYIGDDDYKYSVSTEFDITHTEIKIALEDQIAWIGQTLKTRLKPYGATAIVEGWLAQEETHPEILETRTQFFNSISNLLKSNNLPENIKKRLDIFVNYRKELLNGSSLPVRDDLILDLAIHELTSLVVQGAYAPLLIQIAKPDIPIIFANSYPYLNTQFLEDEVFRFGQKINPVFPSYGTIHVPGRRPESRNYDRRPRG